MKKEGTVGWADGTRSERSERSVPSGAASDTAVPVVVRRRRHTRAYKLRVLEQADSCVRPGELIALARREGLYASTITKWKQWRDHMQGQNTPEPGSEKPESYETLRQRLRKAERENRRLQLRLKRAEGLLEIQKKALDLLDSLSPADENSESI